MKKIIWTHRARFNLIEIKKHIAKDSKFRAEKYIKDLIFEVRKLEGFSELGKVIGVISGFELRELVYKNQYRIVYSIDNYEKPHIFFVLLKR